MLRVRRGWWVAGVVLALAQAVAAVGAGPRLAAAEVRVGCYYFPGHFHAARWSPMRAYGRPTPLLGPYRDGAPGVSDWHIRWAAEHGISFFVFDWYYDYRNGGNTAHNTALDQGFLAARDRQRLEFALMWCNEEPAEAPPYTAEQMLRLGATLGRYVREPNYLRIDGRPLVVVSRPERFVASFGAGFRDLLPRLSQAAGLPAGTDLFLVALAGEPNPLFREMGFAATTGYNYADCQATPHGSRLRKTYADMVDGYEVIWRRMTAPGELPYMVPVSPGWDSRPWYGPRALVRTGATPAAFGDMCERAKRHADPRLNLVVAECWNEFGEGSYLEPCAETGFDYLHALRAAFRPGGEPPGADAVPSEEEKGRFTFQSIPPDPREPEATTSAANRLADPGMEEGTGWVTYGGTVARFAATGSRGGERCLELAPGEGAKAEVAVPVTWGWTYRLSAWVRCAPGASVNVHAAVFADSGRWLGRYLDVGSSNSPTWTEVTRDLRVQAPEIGCLDLEFVAAGGTVWVDDAALTVAAPGPEPAVLLDVSGRSPAQWCTFDGGEPRVEMEPAVGQAVLVIAPGQGVKLRRQAAVKPDDVLRFRVRLRCDEMATAVLRAACFDAQGRWLEGRYLSLGAFSWQEWIEVPGYINVPGTGAPAFINVECVAEGGRVWLDRVRLERP